MSQTPWFTYQDLKDLFTYEKVRAVSDNSARVNWVNQEVIPKSMAFVQKFTRFVWSTPPDDIKGVTMRYAVNNILADDENVKIAQARGQPSFTIAGDQVNLDLTPGRNPFLSDEDELILIDYRNQTEGALHVDKVTNRTDGQFYRDARGRNKRGAGGDYVRPDQAPSYFTGH